MSESVSATKEITTNSMNSTTKNNQIPILIVDDEKTAHQLYKLMLRKKGYKLFHAESGREALDVYKKHPEIKIILMDIKMPDMNGYEATKEIRKTDKNTIIIAQTAYALAADRKKAFESGCNDHLAKPVDRIELLSKLEEYLKP